MRLSTHILSLLLVFSALPAVATAASSEMHFLPDGSISATNVLVYQKAGTNLFCRATWGNAFIRFVVLTNASTVITKEHGEKATVADISEKDIISFDGSLSTGADSLVIVAKNIRDSALQSADKTVSGLVSGTDASSQAVMITDKVLGKITIAVSGASITKGARSISLAEIRAGDKVLSASGTYNYVNNTLTATSVVVHQDGSIFKARNFQGTLKSLSSTDLPTTAVVSVSGTDYTVYLAKDATVMKSSRAKALLTRYVVGDTVRFYGVIRPTNLTEVDAEIIRDLNF